MWKWLIRKIYSLFYALPFAMKVGDEMLATSNKDSDEGSGIHKQIEKKNVLQDLLNGEVTQEVEELRYETFKAEEMSNEYQHIGNGVAVKKDGNDKSVRKKRRKFVQFNDDEEYSLKESLKMMEEKDDRLKDNWRTRKTIKITYKNPNVKFKLENYCYKVSVNLTNDKYETKLYFIDDHFRNEGRPLVNFLKKTVADIERIKGYDNKEMLKSYMERNEICSETSTLSFTTRNASNDVPNGIDYNFKDAVFQNIGIDSDGYIFITYTWRHFDGDTLLSERFYSASADEKFKNKEKRKNYTPVVDMSAKPVEAKARHREQENLEEWFTK